MKPLVGILLGAAIAMSPLAASAACLQTGEIVRVSNTATTSFVYLRNLALTNFYYVCTTTDPDLRSAANSSAAGGNSRAQIDGTVSSCAAAGFGGARSIGTCTQVRLRP